MGKLVMTRKSGESIVIDHRIRVKIVEAAGGKARVAVEAPSEVTINRLEVELRGPKGEADGMPRD